jgi:myo-inositol-1(or 4)-monophosphatase
MAVNMKIGGWDWIEEIQKLCEAAGVFQLKHFRAHSAGWGDEKDIKQYVSWIDVESENILQEGLHAICPEAGFYGEESEHIRNHELEWVVDPLDGTTNYLSGYEQFTISIALVKEGKPQLGVVYKPVSKEYFLAVRGQGARHNKRLLPKRSKLPLSRALIITGFPYRSPDLEEQFFACTKDVLHASRGIRRTGTAALELSYIAAGYFQGFWEQELQAYDIAAALLLLSETGCRYSALHQKPYDMFSDRLIIAGVPETYEALCEIVSRHY